MINDKDMGELYIWSLERIGNLNTRRQIKELIDEVKELRLKVLAKETEEGEFARRSREADEFNKAEMIRHEQERDEDSEDKG